MAEPIVVEVDLDLECLPEGLEVNSDATWYMKTGRDNWQESLAECGCVCIWGDTGILNFIIESA